MDKNSSFDAVKDAVTNGEFHGKVDVVVSGREYTYIYKQIYVSVYYNVPYMQMNVEISWEDDSSQPDYKILNLHVGYNSNFQQFSHKNGYLIWEDGSNRISIKFQ